MKFETGDYSKTSAIFAVSLQPILLFFAVSIQHF